MAVPKKKRKPERWDDATDVSIFSLKLLSPSPTALKRAVDTLLDPANLNGVRKADNISHVAMVGPLHSNVSIDNICHSMCPNMIAKGNNRDEVDWQYGVNMRLRFVETEKIRLFEYLHPRTKKWQDEIPDLPQKKRAFFHYRYMVNWSNDRQKPEYHSDGIDFTAEQKDSLHVYYSWLRNESIWSRFLVGPSDRETLYNTGCIIDLSAPSYVVHMIAVAWRIPGEYIELIEQWHHLVKRGIDPHIAFGAVQVLVGFDKPDGTIQVYCPAGHVLLYASTIELMARLVTGMLHVREKSFSRQARDFYSTFSNSAYTGRCDGFGEKSWLCTVPKSLKITVEVDGMFSKKRKEECVSSAAFQNVYDPGWIYLMSQVGEFINKKEWKRQ